MSKSRTTNIRAQYDVAAAFKRDKNYVDTIKLYENVVKSEPLHLDAQHRLMVLYRKIKEPNKEIKIIKRAITAYRKRIKSDQHGWLKRNKEKADLTRELASSLGLLDTNGLALYQNETLFKWENRLLLLEQRLARSKLKKPTKKNS
ncbi:hypothetical protein ACTJKN_04035 [Pedobacter sp. 22163]|uniref:hypothetical protein n=1 Tax=Pedobacter sp. 22163 TaxID=3453883 RepID=UPI003F8368B7